MIDDSEVRDSLIRALDQLELGLAIYGDGKVVYANRALERIVGYTAQQLNEMNVLEILTPGSRELAAGRRTARAAGEDVPQRYTLQIRSGHGDIRDIEIALAEVRQGDQDRMLTIVRDVTELNAVQARTSQSHKMEAIGKLAQGIAHDFNSYLTAIRLTSEALALRIVDPDTRKLLTELEQVTSGASTLTRQLVTFGGQGAGHFDLLDINVVVFEVLHMVQRLLGDEFEITPDLEPGLPPVRGLEGELQQVVVNLVLNAGEAMPEGGSIVVRTRVEESTKRILLSISDEGGGMSPDVVEHAFEPFYGTKGEHSSGMGLAIVYGIVQRCHGEVWLDSHEGEGTTAFVALPSAEPPFPPIRHRSTSNELRDAAPRVLLVEDEDFVRRLLCEGLERLGFVVRAAGDGHDAMRLIEESEADVLVTDVVMPGPGGEEVAAHFRRNYPESSIIFVSGFPNIELEQGTRDKKVTFLPKPFSASELAEAIRSLIPTKKA